MKNILKGLFVLLILGLSGSAFGQVGFAAGLGFSYGTAPEAVGLHFRGDADINEKWGAGINFITYFVSDYNYWELNFDGRYFFDISEKFVAYPLAGLNISRAGVPNVSVFGNTFGLGATKAGLNLGGGARYFVIEQVSIVGEIKYIVSTYDGLVITVGGMYHF